MTMSPRANASTNSSPGREDDPPFSCDTYWFAWSLDIR